MPRSRTPDSHRTDRHAEVDESIRSTAVLAGLIRCGSAEQAVEWFVQHSAGAFARAFNAAAGGVDGYGVDRVYAGTKRTLEQMVREGDIRDPDHLRRVGIAVLRTNCRHHGCLAYHRDHPLLPPDGPLGVDGEPVRRPLFVSGADAARHAVAAGEPAHGAERSELLAGVLREARGLGRLHLRVAHVYRRFEYEAGTSHGAYPYIARRATLGDAGRVVAVRAWRAAPLTDAPPEPRVVRQVRAIHLEALDRIRVAARRLGADFPPGV